MRRFLARLALFAALQAGLGLVLLARYHTERTSYMAATLDKHRRLEEAPGARLVLIGGSNLAFGIDSERLASAFGRSAVNMGLHMDLGLPFLLQETAGGIHAGDAVVFSGEYQLYGPQPLTTVFHAVEQRPGNVAFVPVSYLPNLLDRAFVYLATLVRNALWPVPLPRNADVYRRNGFTRNGDHRAHYGVRRPEGASLHVYLAPLDRRVAEPRAEQLNRFARQCRGLGGPVYFAYPAVPSAVLNEYPHEVQELDRFLRETLEFPLINRPEEAMLPEESFFDSGYHLTEAGVRQRTNLLIAALAAHGLRQPEASR